jgi:nucleotide-binding universal stress UspA family protein
VTTYVPLPGGQEPVGALASVLGQYELDLQARADELEGIIGARPVWRLIGGDAATKIVEAAGEDGEPALVVVGSEGLGTLDRMRLGSVSTKVLRAAKQSVLISTGGTSDE